MKKYLSHYKNQRGFTLIELLVVISIITIIMAISIFGLTNARQSARDGRRKSDLETVRSALELYRADCGSYPGSLGTSIRGANSSGNTCLTSTTYLQLVPTDPLGNNAYIYRRITNTTYELCSTLEQPGSATSTSCSGGGTSCGSGTTCYYKVTSP